MVSCTMPYKLYFDGKVLGEKNRVLTTRRRITMT